MWSNNYDRLAPWYHATDIKPDKKYSILPTVLSLVGVPVGQTVLDVACGSGFFTFPLAELGAGSVIGVDSSEVQLAHARSRCRVNTEFRYMDVFVDELPVADVVVAPFVANYASSEEQLRRLFRNVHACLNTDGRAVFVFDLPGSGKHTISHSQREKWGAVKWWADGRYSVGTDEGLFINKLFNRRRKQVCELRAYYYRPMTIQFALQETGFLDIRWHKPIISQEGLDELGTDFWHLYPDNSELGYVTVKK